MKEGLLWFDNNPKLSVPDKVGRAAARYRVKFGCQPTTCYLNIADFDGRTEFVGEIRLQPALNIQRNHFWIGIENGVLRAA